MQSKHGCNSAEHLMRVAMFFGGLAAWSRARWLAGWA